MQGSRLVRTCPIHYGYVIFIVATIGKVFTAPGQSPCIGVFIGEIGTSLNSTSTTISGMYLLATTTSAAILPISGRGIDLFGPQLMVLIVSFGLGIACLVMSYAVTELQLLLAFFLLRLFGQGALMNVCICSINYWWVNARGRMMGFAGAFVSAMMLGAIPGILIMLIDTVGWRETYRTLGFAELFFMAPLGYTFLRGRPEIYNLCADGKYSIQTLSIYPNEARLEEKSWSANEVFRSPPFWCFAVADFVVAGSTTAFFFHLRVLLNYLSLPHDNVASVYTAVAICSVFGRLSSGFLIDFLGSRFVLILGIIFIAIGFSVISILTVKSNVIFFGAAIIGIGSSYASNIRSTVYATYYGKDNLGTIQTIASSLTVLGSALGPFPFGYAKDQFGDFKLPFRICALLLILTMFAILRFGKQPDFYQAKTVEMQYSEVDTSDPEGFEE